MPAPLPTALRRRIFEAVRHEGLTIEESARRFMVGPATVKRLLRRVREHGTVEPASMGGDRVSKIPPSEADKLLLLVEDMPDATIAELTVAYWERYGVALSTSAMSRALLREELTRKKRLSSPRSATRRASRTPGTPSPRSSR